MNVDSIALGLVALGYIFIIIELFVPGFGVFGIIGSISALTGLVIGLLYVPYFWIVLVLVILSMILLIKFFKFPRKLILEDKVNEDTQQDKNFLIGKKGVVLTVLKPVGKCCIDDVDYECYSSGGIIQNGTTVVVKEIKENKIFVKPLDSREDNKEDDKGDKVVLQK